MKQNDRSNMQQLLNNREALVRMAKSPEARALAEMLSQGRDPAQLQQAAERAAKGDASELNQLVQSIMRSPGGADLLKRLSDAMGQK